MVSIPHWFSLNYYSISRSGKSIVMFPSHIGSRSTYLSPERRNAAVFVSIPHWFSLNDEPDKNISWVGCVSIPHWFSLNPHPQLHLLVPPFGFPSHIGSRSTGCGRRVVVLRPQVSIPHWFSLNSTSRSLKLKSSLSFHPTLVLAQLW